MSPVVNPFRPDPALILIGRSAVELAISLSARPSDAFMLRVMLRGFTGVTIAVFLFSFWSMVEFLPLFLRVFAAIAMGVGT
jgi:hypothetical protein